MPRRKFDELTKDWPAERHARVKARVDAALKEMELAEIRKERAITQIELAKALDMGQDRVSKFERQEDLLISSLRAYINAMGARLEIRAVFPNDESIVIAHLSDPATKGKKQPATPPL